jgi:hypothetical protein
MKKPIQDTQYLREISTLDLPNTKYKSKESVGLSGKLLLVLAITVILSSGSIQIIHSIDIYFASGALPPLCKPPPIYRPTDISAPIYSVHCCFVGLMPFMPLLA